MKENTGRRKTYFAIFIAICMALVLVPFICMIFARSDEAVGNEMSVSWPSLKDKEGAVNTKILEDMGNYFEHHFAFRPALISADAVVQEKVFKVSNTDSVVTGSDGWLYYSSTLGDFLGSEVLSERGLFNLGNNLRLMQEYAQGRGARFLVMVAPNKNSLYGENMPYYYSSPMGSLHNRDFLKETLEEAGVNYLDLFELFEGQDEVLYLKEDSHWNNKGAVLVYNAALERMKKAHETYEYTPVLYSKSHEGDLRAMIYPAIPLPEYDFTYDYEVHAVFNSEMAMGSEVSVEDFRIESTNEKAGGKLLMYRDSFANTLIPFMSEAFGSAFYSKAVPSNLAGNMDTYEPDHVIIEKVERNLSDFVTRPAIIPAKEVAFEQLENSQKLNDFSSTTDYCSADRNYVEISGSAGAGLLDTGSRICVSVKDRSGRDSYFEAYTLSKDGSDEGFCIFLPLERFGTIEEAKECEVEIYKFSGLKAGTAPANTAEDTDETTEETTGSESEGKTEVSRVAFPSCADPDHGYYEITYSDGSKSYEEY